MLQPIHVLRLSVAVLAVAVGVPWVRSWNAPTWDPRAEYAYPRLQIPRKDGRADLSSVEIFLDCRRGPNSFTLTLRGNGTGTYMSEFGSGPMGPFDFMTDPIVMESWLDEFEALDFMNEHHRCKYRIHRTCDRRWTVRVGDRVRKYRDYSGDYEDPNATARERAWHTRFEAIFNRITRDANVAQWQGEATR